MEDFIAQNPGYVLWVLSIAVGLIVFLWKRDVGRTNMVLKTSLDNNTLALENLANSFVSLEGRVHRNELDIVKIKGDVKSSKILCKKHTATCPMGAKKVDNG